MTKDYSEQFDHGDIAVDRDADDPSDAVVVNTPATAVDEWVVRKTDQTVAEDNPDHPADDPVVIVVYRDTLAERRPSYLGIKPIPIAELNEERIQWYAFPESRLEHVGRLTPTAEIPLAEIDPAPYHARNFDVDANREYIDAIADRGYPKPEPLVRPVDDGYELINGHKRTWAAHVAGLETMPCRVVDLDDEAAARAWADRHLPGYSDVEYETALDELRNQWGDAAAAIAGVARADGGERDV